MMLPTPQEVLKLPPTPTSVADDEGDYDPEAQRVIYEHHNFLDSGPTSGLGYEEMDPAEAREWEQHEDAMQQMVEDERMEKKRKQELDFQLEVEDEDLSHNVQRLSMGSIGSKDGSRHVEELGDVDRK